MPLRSFAVLLMVLSLSSLSLNLYEFPIRNLVGGHADCSHGLLVLSGRAGPGLVLGLGLGLELVRRVCDGLVVGHGGQVFVPCLCAKSHDFHVQFPK